MVETNLRADKHPVSITAGRFSTRWGRKPVFLIALICLPLRGLLFVFGTNPYYLVSVQVLDGISAGIFGVINILIIADLTRGTGRYDVTRETWRPRSARVRRSATVSPVSWSTAMEL